MKNSRLFSYPLALLIWAIILRGSTAGLAQSTQPAATNGPSSEGEPVIIANARQYDFASKLNGQTYRLMVYVPPKLDAAKPAAVVYVLDGSYYFGTACNAMILNSLDGIVVGIGYPSDDHEEIGRRRTFDLSLPHATGSKKYGGGDAFLKVVEQEIKPFIIARYKIDPDRQSLYGHSLGGLMVLRQLFLNPRAYSTYLAASPSIWWNSRVVLGDEEAFSKRARAGELHLRLLLTSATDEQYHGDDPTKLAGAQKVRMVDNATELADRLSALDPEDVKVTRELLNDETHTSGALASLCRALRFALPVEK